MQNIYAKLFYKKYLLFKKAKVRQPIYNAMRVIVRPKASNYRLAKTFLSVIIKKTINIINYKLNIAKIYYKYYRLNLALIFFLYNRSCSV